MTHIQLVSEIQFQLNLWLNLLARPQVQTQLILILVSWLSCRMLAGRLHLTIQHAVHRFTPQNWVKSLNRLSQKLPRHCGPSNLMALMLFGVLSVLGQTLEWINQNDGLVLLSSQIALLWLVGRLGIMVAYLSCSQDEVTKFDRQILRFSFLIVVLAEIFNKFGDTEKFNAAYVLEIENTSLTVGALLTVILGSYYVFAIAPYLAYLITLFYAHLFRLSTESRKTISLVLQYLIVFLGLIFLISTIGVSSTVLAAVTGGLSVGIGFGLKEVLSNFVSGLWLLCEGSVKPGDVIQLDADHCEVRYLGMRATTLWRDRDNAELVIPNQTFFTTSMTTFTRSDRLRRCALTVMVHYSHDPREITKLLEEIALQTEGILSNPAPSGLVICFGDSSTEYQIRFWIDNPMKITKTRSQIAQNIWARFNQMGIEIPFNYLVLEMADQKNEKNLFCESNSDSSTQVEA